MANLLKETVDFLYQYDKSPSDVIWCGSEEFGWFSWGVFSELADKEYDDGFGSPKVCTDLVVVGEDFWLERYEYDGLESWDYKSTPKRPEKEAIPVVIVDDDFMWQTLKQSNRPGGKYGGSDD